MNEDFPVTALSPGRYIVAVSGGVDSMVLLDLLHRQAGLELIVAHLDHGVRPDSAVDRQLVQDVAQRLGVGFVSKTVTLGAGVSEAAARQVRYEFLQRTMRAHHAQAIVMAHHQDDLIETACINMIRGTGWRGLTALRSHNTVVRPLLGVTKPQIIDYARQQGIVWHEDSTNADLTYLRNKLRRAILPQLAVHQKQKLLQIINNQAVVGENIAHETRRWMQQHASREGGSITVARYQLVMLPSAVALEVLQAMCGAANRHSIERPQAGRLLHFAKTAQARKSHHITKQLHAYMMPGGRLAITPLP